MKVEVTVPNKPMGSVDVKQHSTNQLRGLRVKPVTFPFESGGSTSELYRFFKRRFTRVGGRRGSVCVEGMCVCVCGGGVDREFSSSSRLLHVHRDLTDY